MLYLSKMYNALYATHRMLPESGQAMVEYTLLISIVAMAFMGATPLLEEAVKKIFINLGNFMVQNTP